jgi:replication-associated recombination protein RarA
MSSGSAILRGNYEQLHGSHGAVVRPGRLLRRAIQIDQLSSLIFYGPPGTGRPQRPSSCRSTQCSQGSRKIRDAIESAKETLSHFGKRTILRRGDRARPGKAFSVSAMFFIDRTLK